MNASNGAAGEFDAVRRAGARIHEVAPVAAGRSIGDLEREMNGVVIEEVMRGSQIVAVEPALKLQAGDRVAIAGLRELVINHVEHILGPEASDTAGMQLIAEMRDVVVTNRQLAGQTIAQILAAADPKQRRGVFLNSLTRLNQPLPIAPETTLAIGDVARIAGRHADVERASKLIGYPTPPADTCEAESGRSCLPAVHSSRPP